MGFRLFRLGFLFSFLALFAEIVVRDVEPALLDDADGVDLVRGYDELGAFAGAQADVLEVAFGVHHAAEVLEDLLARDLQEIADQAGVVDGLLVIPFVLIVAHGDA